MATTDHPITPARGRRWVGLGQPQPNLLLHPDSWPATGRNGGHPLVAGWRQDQPGDTVTRTSCPVLVEVA